MILLQALINKISSTFSEKPNNKIEHFISAAQEKGLKGIKELQEQGMDLNFIENNASPLMWALKNKKFTEAFLFIESGADLTTLKDSAGLTGLHYAAMFAPEKLMAFILQTLKSKMSSHIAANTSSAKASISSTANLSNPGPALLDILDDFEWTPMFWAIYNKNYKAVELLIEAGANVHTICNGQTYLQRIIGDRYNNFKNETKIDPKVILHLVDLFIKKGIGVDTIPPLTDFTHTPLYSAVSWQDIELCERLVKAGADPNKPCGNNNIGTTPFFRAAELCNEYLLDYFLSRNFHGLHSLDNLKRDLLAKVLLSRYDVLNVHPHLRYRAAMCLVLAGAPLDVKVENKTLLELAHEKGITQEETFKFSVLSMPHLISCFKPEYFQAIANYFEGLYLKQSKAEFGKEDIHLINMYFFMIEMNKKPNNELDRAAQELFLCHKETIIESAKQNKELTESILCTVLKHALKQRLYIYFFKPRDEQFFAPYMNQVLFEKGLLQDETQALAHPTPFNLPNTISTLMLQESLFLKEFKDAAICKPLGFSQEASSPFYNVNVQKTENIIIQTRYQRLFEAVDKWQAVSLGEQGENKQSSEKAQITVEEVYLECFNIKEKKSESDKPDKKAQGDDSKSGDESKKQCEYAKQYYWFTARQIPNPCDHSTGNKTCKQCQTIQPFFMRVDWVREIPAKQVHLLEMLTDMNNSGELFHHPIPQGKRMLVFRSPFEARLSPWSSSPSNLQQEYVRVNGQQQRAICFHNCKDCQRMEIAPIKDAPHAKEFCHSTAPKLLTDEAILQSFSLESDLESDSSVDLKAKLDRLPTKRGKLIPNKFYFNQDQFPKSVKFPDDVLLRIHKDAQSLDKLRFLKEHEIKIMLDDVEMPFKIIDNILYVIIRTNPFAKLHRPSEYDHLRFSVVVYYLNNDIDDQKAIQIIQSSDQKSNSKSSHQQSIGRSYANSQGKAMTTSVAVAQKAEMIFKSSFSFYMWAPHVNADMAADSDSDQEDHVASQGVVVKRRYHMDQHLQVQGSIRGREAIYGMLQAYLNGHFNSETNLERLKQEKSRRNDLYTEIMKKNVDETRLYTAQVIFEVAQYIKTQRSNSPVLHQGLLQLLDLIHSLGVQGQTVFIQLVQMYFPLLFKESAQITLQLRREPPNAAPQFVILEITLTSLGRIKAGLNRIILEYVGEDLMSNADCIPAEIFTVQDQKLFTINESIEAESREEQPAFYPVTYIREYLLELLNINQAGEVIPVPPAVNTNPMANGTNSTPPLLLSQPAVNQSSPAQNEVTNPPEFTDRKDNVPKKN